MNLVFQEQANSPVKIKAYYQVALIFLLTLLMLTTRSTCLAYSTSSSPLSDITISDIDGEGCCFQLNYNYDGALGNIDGLETRILTPNVLFSSVQFPLASGWSYNELMTQRRLRWSHNSGSIPQGQQSLADFCFSGWNTAEPVELLVIWRNGNSVRQRDTIQIACSKCWLAENPIVNCEPDSSYTYTFDYVNLSEFTVDYLQIRERNDQNIVIEQNIPLATSLSPGASIAGLQLHFRSTAIQFEEICFEITPRHIINDSIAIRCCTAEYCVPIPICDRCCTEYDVFVTDVERGFTISTNCEEMTVRLQAIGLNECDRVEFDLGLGAGIVRGNEAVIFGNLDEDQFYEVTMTVIRQSMDGEDCYEEASLSIFDDFVFDCAECINGDNVDYEIICPAIEDFVCGCDEMTYLNACAASNWGGVSTWNSGCCDDLKVPQVDLVVTIDAMGDAQLEWMTNSTANIRYFIIQRQTLNGPWFNLDQVDNMTFSFVDTAPLNPIGDYRIIGVSLEGKIILSEACMEVSTIDLNILEGGNLFPNPANQQLNIELPIQDQHLFEIWNSTGQRLYQSQTNYQGKAQIPTNQWPSGYYYITAYINHHTLWRKPFIIDH